MSSNPTDHNNGPTKIPLKIIIEGVERMPRRLLVINLLATRTPVRESPCNNIMVAFGYPRVFRDVFCHNGDRFCRNLHRRNLRRMSRGVHVAEHQAVRREQRGGVGPTRDLRFDKPWQLNRELNQLSGDTFHRRTVDINPGH